MQTNAATLAHLSDEQLIAEVEKRAAHERQATADLIASLVEMEGRLLYRGLGFSSMFAYCTQRLHRSEDATCNRLEVARAARQFPMLLDLVVEGSLTLTAARLLAPLLTEDNHATVLAAAAHKSKREVQELIATLRPAPDLPSSVRKLPAARTSAVASASLLVASAAGDAGLTDRADLPTVTATPGSAAPAAVPIAHRAVVAPLASERYKIQFTVGRETHDRLRRVQDLLARSVPHGDLSVIFDRALMLLLAQLERKTLAKTDRRRTSVKANPAARYIPAAVKRTVWARDEGRCAFVGSAGRCTATRFLEFHHVVPFAGGGPTEASNLQLRCRTHNAYEAELRFGPLCVRERDVPYWPAQLP